MSGIFIGSSKVSGEEMLKEKANIKAKKGSSVECVGGRFAENQP